MLESPLATFSINIITLNTGFFSRISLKLIEFIIICGILLIDLIFINLTFEQEFEIGSIVAPKGKIVAPSDVNGLSQSEI